MNSIEDIVYEAIRLGVREALDTNFKIINNMHMHKYKSVKDKYFLAFDMIQ